MFSTPPFSQEWYAWQKKTSNAKSSASFKRRIMEIAGIKITRLQILVIFILIIGLIVGLILVQKQHIFKGKAGSNIYDSFDVTNPSGSPLPYTDNGSTRTYSTDDLKVNIRIKDLNLGE